MRDEAAEPNLSKYRIGPLLGAGGMGEVYLARDTSLNRDVAIKFIAADRLGDPDARRRLIREAQAAAALDHPSICAVYEVVDSPTRPFIVMQHVEGENLAQRLARGPLPADQAVTLALHVADALADAHRRGVVHRDLKPQNIILTPSGRPKIVDFGIARLRPALVEVEAFETRTNLTNPQVILGTPAYMAPEQIQLLAADGRADLFSLGAVFYESLTARRAFDGRSTIEICGQVLHHHPEPPSHSRPELTAAHDAVCQKLLAKDPAARFQTADDVVDALRELQTVTDRGSFADHRAAAQRWRLPGSRRMQGATLALLLAMVVGIWGWTRRDRLPPLPPEAERAFVRGTDFIREGAYYSARLSLEYVVRVAPDYPPAQARLAEALLGLDEENDAQAALLKVGDRSLRGDERLRLDAVRASVLHQTGAAVEAYSRLTQRRSRDARAWVDLGRAYETAGQPIEARRSYERALDLEPEYAAAHLRRALLDANEGRRQEALAGFDRAERLYRAASDREGETETLIRRGGFLDGVGELAAARKALERAQTLALATDNEYQSIRVDIRFSSVTASEGQLRESERLAREAIQRALDLQLLPLAADGLIELGATLMNDQGRLKEAEEHLQRAVQLAEGRGSAHIAARARLNLSSLHLSAGRPEKALQLAEDTLPTVRARRFRRLEISALGLRAEAYEARGNYGAAREAARDVLAAAEQIGDTPSMVQALLTLGRASLGLGLLPDALSHSTRVEQMLRAQGDTALLPFTLVTRAELLIRLGRGPEAQPLLLELEEGIASKRETYVGRARRVALAWALQATLGGRYPDAARHAADALAAGPRKDTNGDLAAALLANAQSRLGRRAPEPPRSPTTVAPTALEGLYWRALSVLSSAPKEAVYALEGVLQGEQSLTSVETEWRLAAVGAAAASASGDTVRAAAWRSRAEEVLQRLRAVWKSDARLYEARPDLQELRRVAGVSQPPV